MSLTHEQILRLRDIVIILKSPMCTTVEESASSSSVPQPLTKYEHNREHYLQELYSIIESSAGKQIKEELHAETTTGVTVTSGLPATMSAPGSAALESINNQPYVLIADYVAKISTQQEKFDQHFSRADQQHYRLEEHLRAIKQTHTDQLNSQAVAHKQLLLLNEQLKKQVEGSTEHVQRLKGHLEISHGENKELKSQQRAQQEELFNARRDLQDLHKDMAELDKEFSIAQDTISKLSQNLGTVQIENCKLLVEKAKLEDFILDAEDSHRATVDSLNSALRDAANRTQILEELGNKQKQTIAEYEEIIESNKLSMRRLEQAMTTVEKQSEDSINETRLEITRLKQRVTDSEAEKISLMRSLEESHTELQELKKSIQQFISGGRLN